MAAAILWPSGAAPAAAQSAEPAVTCFEISVGWRICVAPSPQPAQSRQPCADRGGPALRRPGLVADCGGVTDGRTRYAFLTDPNWSLTTAITTWDEGLRDAAAR